jgi:hypothetical protein
MTAPVIQFKRGLFTNLPGLRAGEPGFTTDSYELYVGIDSTTNNNKFFGSHRYWTRETTTTGSGVNLVEGSSNGSQFITLAAPGTLAGITTYYFPGTQGTSSSVLTNDGNGNLSWSGGSANPVFTGIATFSDTTDNTLGNENTGSVQLDGGMGIAKNLTVKQNLHVGGYAEFVGVVTFKGGTINIGDENTDNINVGGEFISGLAPNADNTFDIGISTQRWRDAYFSGIGSFAAGAYIDAVQIGITATNEIDTTSGNLILDSAAGTVEIQDNLTVSGVATVTGAFVANGNVTLGDTSGDTITVNGTTTFNQPLVGTIGTATRATLVDTTTAPSGTFYPGLFVNNTGTASTAVFVDAGISYVSNTDTLTLTGDVAINGGDATTTATTFNLINGTATNVNFAGAATALVMGATTGIGTIRNATISFPNATTVNVNGANPTLASSSTGLLTLFNTNLTGVNAFGAATALVMGAATGITTVSNNLTVAGDIRVNGNDIQSSTGTVAITLADNDVTIADDLTVQGNLYVNGSTTQVNTAALTVEDRTIDLGIVNGAAPAGTTTWDLGVLFNYNSSGAKKSAVIWEHADARFKFASVLASDTDGSTVDTPQLTVTTFAPVEIGQLWVTDCAGTSQVISCTGTERNLENITIDAGTFV